jgi:hypothetical protein
MGARPYRRERQPNQLGAQVQAAFYIHLSLFLTRYLRAIYERATQRCMTRFSRFLSIFPLVLACAAPVAFPADSFAQQGVVVAEPLVVIRFNQPNVYYAQQLHGAISKAVETKSAVLFEVVSYAPVTGIGENDTKWQGIAGRHTKAVVAAMMEMGVPAERISVRGEAHNGIQYDETHLFVR